MKAYDLRKTDFMATLYQGKCHIDRRVWENEDADYCVIVNGTLLTLDWCQKHYDRVVVWS